MNLAHITYRPGIIVIICCCVLANPVLVGLGQSRPASSQEATSRPTTSMSAAQRKAQEAIILEFVRQAKAKSLPDEGGQVKHLAGRYYTVELWWLNGHGSKLFLTDGKEIVDVGGNDGVGDNERGLEPCLSALIKEEGTPKSDEEFRRAVERCLLAVSADYGVIVQRNADIPGYDKHPLPKDLEGVIRPIWSSQLKIRPDKPQLAKRYVAYTYQEIGGQVFRHQITFSESGTHAVTTRLAKTVGNTVYLR